MELVHEMTYHAMLRAPLAIGPGPFGDRMFFEAIEGKLTVRGSADGSSAVAVTGCCSGRTGSGDSTCAPRSRPTMARSCTCNTTVSSR